MKETLVSFRDIENEKKWYETCCDECANKCVCMIPILLYLLVIICIIIFIFINYYNE